MTRWLNGPKHPGLMILEHELNDQTVQAFMDAYPLMIQTGWKLESAADVDGNSVYQNSKDGTSPVEKAGGVINKSYTPPASSTTTSTTPATPTSTSNTSSNAGSNTSQSGNNGSIKSTVSKFAGALGAIFLTVVFYAW